MKSMAQRSVRTILSIISAIGVLVFVVYFALNFIVSIDSNERLNNLEKNQLPMLVSINNASINILQVKEYLSSAIISSDADAVTQAEYYSQSVIKELQTLANSQESFAPTAKHLLINHKQYWQHSKKLALAMLNGSVDYDNLLKLSEKMNASYVQVSLAIDALKTEVLQDFADNLKKVRERSEYGLLFGFIISGFFLIFTVSATKWTVNRFVIPLNTLTKHADAVAEGKFDHKVKIKSQDEFGQLALAFNKMSANLHQLVIDLEESRDKALAAFKSKSEFLASMSHEIRTPMNGVLGMLGLLARSNLTSEQQHRVNLATSSAESLLTLINDILDFSKVEAGKLDIEILDFNLRTMLGEFAETIALKAQEKDVEIILDVSQIQYSHVRGDAGRIRQILTNLVGNAIKFTSDGEIVIKAAISKASEQQLKFTCTITDSGIGIPEHKLNSIFDSFTQVDASTTRQYGGTGLGLAISKKLCQLMQGNIDVSSVINEGSCFSFTIILNKSEQSTQVIPSVDIKGVDLLVVDDNQTNREVLTAQLELWGAIVVEAKDGQEALTILLDNKHKNIKVAFLDMQMPEMSGAQLGEKIRAIPSLHSLKLVMMTSMGSRGDAQYFEKLGFNAYFPKPTTTSDLFDTLALTLAEQSTSKSADIITHQYLQSCTHDDQQNNHQQGNYKAKVEQLSQCRLLLVEDNRINQEVARCVLAEFGIHIDIAANGFEALQSLQNAIGDDAYDLILMDCQMPEMDGYQATQAIRAGDAGLTYLNIPIIAMTANAMKGDKEKCLDAGMSDYLSKPINKAALQDKLLIWFCPVDEIVDIQNVANNSGSLDQKNNKTAINTKEIKKDDIDKQRVWDQQKFLQRLNNNQTLVNELIAIFLVEVPEQMAKLHLAFAQKNSELSKYCIHSILGIAGNINANDLAQACKELQVLIKANNFDQQAYQALLVSYQRLISLLETYS